MSENRKIEHREQSKRVKAKLLIGCTLCFSLIIFFSAILQTTCLSVFGSVPALTLAIVCAIGFVSGEKAGAISGILTGALVDILGSNGGSVSPILFMLCGYFCGAFVGWFLSKNLPSFLLYAAIAGLLREAFTLVYVVLKFESLSIGQIFLKIIIPEYFAYALCIIPAYGAVFGIYRLFKGKDIKEKIDH